MCPVNSREDTRGAMQRVDDLRRSLAALMPILGDHGILGLVEPLGFAESSLRLKRVAVEAIDAVGGGAVFRLVHDTFHHFLAGETELFPERSRPRPHLGRRGPSLPHDAIRDAHRVLVGPGDLTENVGQIGALLAGGYRGPFSFEPFAESVQGLRDQAGALRAKHGVRAPGSGEGGLSRIFDTIREKDDGERGVAAGGLPGGGGAAALLPGGGGDHEALPGRGGAGRGPARDPSAAPCMR